MPPDGAPRTKVRTGTIFDIQRFAVHDGPGIRTTVFLKGCSLRCRWCHNPEGIFSQRHLIFTALKCVACRHCLEVCPQGAHQFVNGQHLIARERCQVCGKCTEGCYVGALELAGREVTVEEVMKVVLQDRPFYERSGGGMTLSGGEPLVQHNFTGALLRVAKAEGLHAALDTCGFAPWRQLAALLPWMDLVLYDLKHMDSQRHKALTGVPNERILDNLRQLDAVGKTVWIRIPLIPQQNDDEPNFHAIGRFLSGLKHVQRIEILRYHPLAESKYEGLGWPYSLRGLKPPTEQEAEPRRQTLLSYGLPETIVR